jgi:hypothetical protein
LAELTLKGFPKERLNFFALVNEPLAVNPLLEAGDMDHSHRTSTFAWAYQFVWQAVFSGRSFFFCAQADSADCRFLIGAASDD